MEYKLLASRHYEDLSKNVNEHIKKGWELYGSPVISGVNTSHSSGAIYGQAMTKKDNS